MIIPMVHENLHSYRRRTRWSMTASFGAHVLILLGIVLSPHASSRLPELTEITLIEPGEDAAAPASAGSAASAVHRSSGAVAPSDADESFRRLARGAEITPEPQSTDALDDRISARLAALQQDEPAPVRGIGEAAMPTSAWGSPATVGAGSGGNSPLSLTRGGTGTGPALSLVRGGAGTGPAPAIAATGLPAPSSATAAPARGGDATARRSLAGAMLMGPVADRPVISYVRPVYPEWAKRDAVEGSVTLHFVVRPDGSVKENVLVERTAGFEDFDESARTALRQWRFAPLGGGRTGEQWGAITFNFRLRGTD